MFWGRVCGIRDFMGMFFVIKFGILFRVFILLNVFLGKILKILLYYSIYSCKMDLDIFGRFIYFMGGKERIVGKGFGKLLEGMF